MSATVQDLDWLLNGISSECIWRVMNGADWERHARQWFDAAPTDPDDFSRCYLLLQRNPTWRIRLDEMRKVNGHWAALVDHWEELEGMFLAIFGGSFTHMDYHSRKPYDKDASARMYHRMKDIEREARP